MKEIIFMLVCVYFLNMTGYSQDIDSDHRYPIKIERTTVKDPDQSFLSQYVGTTIINGLKTKLKQKGQPNDAKLFSVKSQLFLIDEAKIETFETSVVVELETVLKFVAKGIWPDSMMVIIQTKGKGTSKRSAVKKAATQVLMQEKFKSFTADIFQYFEKNYDQQLDVSLQKLGNLAPGDLNTCQDVLEELRCFKPYPDRHALIETERTKALELCQQYSCDQFIRKMRIKAESGAYDSRVLTNQLLQIPPSAPCAGEVLEIAQLIGSKNNKLTVESREYINQIIQIHQNENIQAWRLLRGG